MKEINDGSQTFLKVDENLAEDCCTYGMSLRDNFAGRALQGICASGPSNDFTNKMIAAEAYKLADAMLEERNKK